MILFCLNIKKNRWCCTVLRVNSFFQKIESVAEKINLSLFEDFFGSSSPVDYGKAFINTKNPDKNKESVVEIKDRLSDLKDKIKKWAKKKKK